MILSAKLLRLLISSAREKHYDQRHRCNNTLHQRGVGENVKLNIHCLNSSTSDERDTGIALGTGVKHGVEWHHVQVDSQLLHIHIRAEDLFGTLGHGEAFGNGAVSHGVDAGPRVLSESDSALRLAAHSSVGPPPCNQTSQDRAVGNRFRNSDRGSICSKMLQASTAHKSKASSTSVSSTRSKTRLTSHWWVCAVRPFNRMEHVTVFTAMFANYMLSRTFQIIRNDASVQELGATFASDPFVAGGSIS